MSDRCMLQVLAQSPLGRIEYCNHGIVHFHVGPMTLRLESEHARELAMMMGRAMRSVDMIEMALERPELSLVPSEEPEIC